MKPQVGFIGLGIMGRPMALNLISAGYSVSVWNRTEAKLASVLKAGASAVKSPQEIAQKSEIIFTMLTDGPQVREVILGPKGIIHGAHPGLILIDTSSISPAIAREIAGKLADKEVQMLDAPVSGGPEGAAKATLSIMVGGEEEIFQRVLPLLQKLGKTVTYVGSAGSGQMMKLCNQVACCMNILGMAEALALGKRAGLELATIRKVLLAGAAGSWMLENWAPKILNADYSPGFTVANFQKDLRNVLREAESLEMPLPMTGLARQLYRANEAAGESQESNVAIYKVLLRLAGEDIS